MRPAGRGSDVLVLQEPSCILPLEPLTATEPSGTQCGQGCTSPQARNLPLPAEQRRLGRGQQRPLVAPPRAAASPALATGSHLAAQKQSEFWNQCRTRQREARPRSLLQTWTECPLRADPTDGAEQGVIKTPEALFPLLIQWGALGWMQREAPRGGRAAVALGHPGRRCLRLPRRREKAARSVHTWPTPVPAAGSALPGHPLGRE